MKNIVEKHNGTLFRVSTSTCKVRYTAIDKDGTEEPNYRYAYFSNENPDDELNFISDMLDQGLKAQSIGLVNWQPEHLPVGTVVVMKDYYKEGPGKYTFKVGGNAEFTITGLSHQGGDQYVADTGEWNAGCGISQCFSLSHITSIKKRGDGPVLIKRWRGDDAMPNLKEMVSNDLLNKNKYYASYAPELVGYLLIHHTSFPKSATIMPNLVDDFLSQTFVHRHGHEYFGYISVDKKRAKRWLRQNANRFITPMKTVRLDKEAEEKAEYMRYCRDMDDQFDHDYPPLPDDDNVDETFAGQVPVRDGTTQLDSEYFGNNSISY